MSVTKNTKESSKAEPNTKKRRTTRSRRAQQTVQDEQSVSEEKVKQSQKEQAKKEKTSKKSTNQSSSITDEALRIVGQAATILEEEISAGIVAAKKVEERYVNVNELRSGEPEKVIQRFRKDAHEVLDILLDLVNLSFTAISGLSEQASTIRTASVSNDKNKTKSADEVTELVIAKNLKPGESGKVSMLVENSSDQATADITFKTAGMLNEKGDLLDAQNISIEPHSLQIAANDFEKISVLVSIPAGTVPGLYSGLIQASEVQVRAILSVQVEQTS